MKLITLSLPTTNNIGGSIFNPTEAKFAAGSTTIGDVASTAYRMGLYAAGFLMFIWMAWGVFDYLIAQGNKEGLAKARARIRWSLIGFLIYILSILIGLYAQTIFPQVKQFYNGSSIEQVTDPEKAGP